MGYTESNRRWGTLVFVGVVAVFATIILWEPLGALLGGQRTPTPGSTPAATLPPNAVEVYFYNVTTKENWIEAVTASFNADGHTTSRGNTIVVRLKHGNSGGSLEQILNGVEKAQAWSPGDQSYVERGNAVRQAQGLPPLVPDACRPTVLAPIGIAMWRPFAEAMGWPDQPIGWNDLVALAADPQGWASYGHPEWGQFKFGHTNPISSNSGMLILTALVHDTLNQLEPLTPQQVFLPEVTDAMRNVEQLTYHYGVQSRNLLNLMATKGPDYLHAVNTSEAEMIKVNIDRASELVFPLVFVFPANGTYWSEQPYCVINADWVSDEQKEAANIYGDYLLHPDQQKLTVENYLRPVDPAAVLQCPLCLEQGTDPGVTLDSVPALASPSDDVAEAVRAQWQQTKRKATMILVLDTSGSMTGDKLKNARTATQGFLGRLHPGDWVAVMTFGSDVSLLGQGQAAVVSEDLVEKLNGIFASGSTALYDAVCEAAKIATNLQQTDMAAGERRLYGVVVLSDGQDTASDVSGAQMFATCLPTGDEVEGVRVYTIAYGGEANADVLSVIATQTNGRFYEANEANIDAVYGAISAEQ